MYECHPIGCLHNIVSALEMIAIDFSAIRQPLQLLKLIKYFTILCLTNWSVKLKKKTLIIWGFGNLFGLKCQQRLLTNSPKAKPSQGYLQWRDFQLKWDFQEPLRDPNTFVYLLVGKFFMFNGKLPKFKSLLQFYQCSWSWLRWVPLRILRDLGQMHDIKHSIFSQGSFASLTLKVCLGNIWC